VLSERFVSPSDFIAECRQEVHPHALRVSIGGTELLNMEVHPNGRIVQFCVEGEWKCWSWAIPTYWSYANRLGLTIIYVASSSAFNGIECLKSGGRAPGRPLRPYIKGGASCVSRYTQTLHQLRIADHSSQNKSSNCYQYRLVSIR